MSAAFTPTSPSPNSGWWTPGPWKVDGEEVVCARDDSFICNVSGGDDYQDAADRALIAAAPELYEDLAVLVKAFGQSSEHGLWKRARATLAKAMPLPPVPETE